MSGKRYSCDGSKGGRTHERYRKGKGYWMQINKRRHLREQQYAYEGSEAERMGLLICPMCGKGFRSGQWYVYVIPTGDCVHMGACICNYPRSIWIERSEGVEEVDLLPKLSKEDQYFLDAAVEEVIGEGREVSEVAEEFDIDEERLRQAVEQRKEEEE